MSATPSLPSETSAARRGSAADVFLYRGKAGDGAQCLVTFDRDTLLLARAVAGLPCKIRLATRQFRAVASTMRGDRHVVHLMHRDPGLSIDLAEAASAEDAEDHCERLAAFLDLPRILMGGRSMSGDTVVAGVAPAHRRNQAARLGKHRRARFLTRRKGGGVVALQQVAGRELIART